ncbi:MAG: hypothetical protein AAGD13_12365 [Pseudomonadota bacterium]
MSAATPPDDSTLTLSTKVEEDFISPATAIRGALEILRDYPDMTEQERQSFVVAALEECHRLEAGIDHLSDAVYAAARNAMVDDVAAAPVPDSSGYSDRIRFDAESELLEIDFSGIEFDGSDRVNEFYDAIDSGVNATGRKWYIIVNNTDCKVWPEAWVAFAHRGKKVNVNFSLGTFRFSEIGDDRPHSDPSLLPSRADALAEVAALRAQPSWKRSLTYR